MSQSSAIVILLLTGIFQAAASAEEFVLRVENVIFENVDQNALHEEIESGGMFNVQKAKGKVSESLEVHVKREGRFDSKAKIGKKNVKIRGELKPHSEANQFEVKISAEFTTYTGMFIPHDDGRSIEVTDENSVSTTVIIELDKPQMLGLFSKVIRLPDDLRLQQTNLQCTCLILEPAKTSE